MGPNISVADADDVLRGSPFGSWWGFETIGVEIGAATLRLPARPHHYRPAGLLQGGCCMALADVTFWIALMTVHGVDDPAVTLEMKTNFLAAAAGNLTCTARLVRDGRMVAFGTAETVDAHSRIIAHHTVTYLRPGERLTAAARAPGRCQRPGGPASQRPGQWLREARVGDGLITVESRFPVSETIDRLVAAATGAGLLVFARIDHQKGALDAGLDLRPTELLIFGHPRGGTPLMQESQPAGIDLPFKALAWQDEHGRVRLTWNDAQWLAQRHRLSAASASAVQAIRSGMNSLAAAATGA